MEIRSGTKLKYWTWEMHKQIYPKVDSVTSRRCTKSETKLCDKTFGHISAQERLKRFNK